MQRTSKYVLLLSLVVLSLSLFLNAESTSCYTFTVIVPDGRIRYSTIPASTTFYLGFYATAGHSYSIEFTPDTESYNNLPITVQVQDGNTYCTGPTTLPLNDTTRIDPLLNAGGGTSIGFRKTLTVATLIGNGIINISVQNTSATAHTYTFSVTDLTMYNPRWSTWGGFNTSWGFKNTTNTSLQGTLNIYNTGGTLVQSVTFSIPAHLAVFKFSGPSDLNLAPNQAGGAEFYHNGPPGAILADCYFSDASGSIIVFSEFKPVRQAQH